jgi:hypothetical protein
MIHNYRKEKKKGIDVEELRNMFDEKPKDCNAA